MYDSLPAELQAILRYAAEAANTANFALGMDNYSRDLQGLINEDGVNVHRTPQSVMEAQLAAWDTVLEDLMQDPFFKKVVDSQKAWSERVGFYYLTNAADYKLAFDHYFPGRLGF
jgi:TRAP-type mannitol/chloroaromatic compound transport system substrate-binding protein